MAQTPEQLAADYGYNVEALRYQRDRREGGSFTTTADGSADQYRLYARAWAIAVTREANNDA